MSDKRKRQLLDRHPERGAVLVIVAVVLPVIMIMGAVVIDLGHLFKVRTQLQATADASALAGVRELPNATNARTLASEYAAYNYPGFGTVVANDDIVPGNWNGSAFTPAGTPTNALRVTARRSTANDNEVPLFLGGFVGRQFSNVSASAVAVFTQQGGGACIYVLNPTVEKALFIASGTTVHTCDVKVHSNRGSSCPASSSSMAFSLESNSRLYAYDYTVEVRGGCYKTGDSQWDPVPVRGGDVPDPLAGIPHPTVPDRCDRNGSPSKIESSGTYPASTNADGFYVWCGGLHVALGSASQTATLRPGIHVMRGGGLKMDKGILIANDVMFYNTCNNSAASCSSSGSSAQRIEIVGSETTFNQTAPPGGTYQGLLFFQNRLMSTSLENTFGSGATLNLDGVMYFPTQHLIIGSGTRILQGNKITFVADRITIASGTTLTFKDLPTRAPGELLSGHHIALVQ